MRRLAALYWRHEAWGLRAVVSNEPFIALIRLETQIVWYITPLIFFLWARSTFLFGDYVSWILMGFGVVSLIWAAFGAFWLSFSLGYVVEGFSFNSPVATEHPRSQKRLDLLERRLGQK